MKLIKLLPIFLLLCSITINAQNSQETQTINSGTIENQFDYLIKNSNRYEDKKVVKRVWLDQLKSNVSDSLNVLRKELATTKNILSEKEAEITKLTSTLNLSNDSVAKLSNEKGSMSFFGMLISKPLYNTILWSIIGVLLLGLIIYILRFGRSNTITKEANNKFFELETEYESHRQRSLEREQQLRRKLQDELNKQKRD